MGLINRDFITDIRCGYRRIISLRSVRKLVTRIRRKAEPFCRKLNSGYHQYSRVDVRTRESSVDHFVRDNMMDNHLDIESDNEDDPTKLLDQWLGELNTLKKGLGAGVKPGVLPAPPQTHSKPVMRERKVPDRREYRCSLINLDTSQDEELDAILGELTVLESQFEQEIQDKSEGKLSGEDSALSPLSPASDRSSNITDLGIHSATHSRSSSGSDELKARKTEGGERRTDSPDTDSAFCDNLSVLSSCSTASSSKTGQSIGVPSTLPAITKEEQDARIKAEKIKIAIEKIFH